MSAGIVDNRQTIDLTGIDTDEEDDEVQFLGQTHPPIRRTPLRHTPAPPQRFDPPGGWPQPQRPIHPGVPAERIIIDVDAEDDDEQEERAVDRLIPHQPQHNPPLRRHNAMIPLRIFSPPAQFRAPPRNWDPLYNRRPTPHPFGIEDELELVQPRLPIRPPTPPPPVPAVPRIGLGGGYMAFRANPRNREPERRIWIQDFRDAFRATVGGGGGVQVDIPAWGGMVWDAGRNEAIGGPVEWQPWHIAGDERLQQQQQQEGAKPSYTPAMTHGGREKPRPGFSFDFEPSASPDNAPIVIDVDASQGASSSTALAVATPTLICARCNAGLRMGSKTMWGLRCGHVVCGECGEYLSKPVEGKGKGKAEEEDVVVPPPPSRDVKGKGKAKALNSEVDDLLGVATTTRRRGRSKPAANVSTSTRSLRSSTLQASAESMSQLQAQPSAASASTSTTAAATSVGRKRKRVKKQDTKPVLLEEYEYACPVEGCFRPHFTERWKQPKNVSKEREDGIVEMELVWKPKPNLGAIPIFT